MLYDIQIIIFLFSGISDLLSDLAIEAPTIVPELKVKINKYLLPFLKKHCILYNKLFKLKHE